MTLTHGKLLFRERHKLNVDISRNEHLQNVHFQMRAFPKVDIY